MGDVIVYRYIKRFIDIVLSFILLIVLSPLIGIVALLILLQHDGPILFKQERPGKDGKIFMLHKFRTMSTVTEKDGRTLSDMERISKFGNFLRKTSIDELPQFFDILRGKMSFIGPRPLVKNYLPLYNKRQMRRHEVLPGISGWAQINGRNTISWEEKFELDVYYVDHMSFALDVKIFFLTLKNVIMRSGINSSESNTMEPFLGTPETSDTKQTVAAGDRE